MGKFKLYLDEIREETSASDVASVDTKMDLRRNKHLEKGKKCQKHKRLNCSECLDKESKWN